MNTFTDILVEQRRAQEDYFRNYRKWGERIKEKAGEILGEVPEVYIFGSVLREDETPRDIDVLVVSPALGKFKKSDVRVPVLREIGYFSPFEIHLATPREYEEWYSKFLREKVEV